MAGAASRSYLFMNITSATPTTDVEWAFIESLFTDAFPADERPSFDRIRELHRQSPFFKVNLFRWNDFPVGFISQWDFDTFTYVEHAAFDPSVRGKGLGSSAFAHLLNRLDRPCILEVEPPTGDIEKRRIGFYERLGFKLSPYLYVQPPYSPDKHPLMMRLMTHNSSPENESTIARQIEIIYQNVYQTSVEMMQMLYPTLFNASK